MRRWYTHGWNTTTSLRLIFMIIPRVPRPLVPPIGVVTTSLCIASMKRERRAAARNLRRILGAGGWRLWRTLFALFYKFSRFMVGYCALLPRGSWLEPSLAADPAGEARIREALTRGRGLIVLTAHLGDWEVGTRLLERSGSPVSVVMRVERTNAAERWLQRLRRRRGVRVLDPGRREEGVLALRAALARNEVLAMQGDRTTGGRTLPVEMFGASFPLPLGPFLLAYGCDATLLPAFVLQEGWWRSRSEIGPAVRFPRTEDRDADLAAGARQYAHQLEAMVRKHPDQWFNFYELWPDEA